MLGSAIRVGTEAPQAKTIKVYFNPVTTTDQLQTGMAVCYDRTASAANRYTYVVKPTLNNVGDFAGIVAPGQKLAAGATEVEIIPWDGTVYRGVQVYTDEDVTTGDYLGVVPGEYVLGKWTVGRPVFQAMEAFTGATTAAGLVKGYLGVGNVSNEELGSKCLRYFNHFAGTGTASATADATEYAATLLSGTITQVDDLTLQPSSGAAVAATAAAYGALKLTSSTTSEVCCQLNGEPFSISATQSIFFRARVALSSVATQSAWFGLSNTDTTPTASLPSDHIGFKVLVASPGLVTFTYNNSGGTAVTKSTAITLTNNTFAEFAVLVRMKSTSAVDIHLFANGTEVASVTETLASIPYDESLTVGFGHFDSTSAQSMYVDRVEVYNYVG